MDDNVPRETIDRKQPRQLANESPFDIDPSSWLGKHFTRQAPFGPEKVRKQPKNAKKLFIWFLFPRDTHKKKPSGRQLQASSSIKTSQHCRLRGFSERKYAVRAFSAFFWSAPLGLAKNVEIIVKAKGISKSCQAQWRIINLPSPKRTEKRALNQIFHHHPRSKAIGFRVLLSHSSHLTEQWVIVPPVNRFGWPPISSAYIGEEIMSNRVRCAQFPQHRKGQVQNFICKCRPVEFI